MRLQILHLPCAPHEHKFALVFDETSDAVRDSLLVETKEDAANVAASLGAEGILVFQDTVEVL